MDFITMVSQFFTTYMMILMPFFMLGLANMLAPTFSYAFALFSIFSLSLYFVLSEIMFVYFAIGGIAVAVALKWLGY